MDCIKLHKLRIINKKIKFKICVIKFNDMNEEDIQKNNQSLIIKIKELHQIKSKYEDALNYNRMST